MILYLTETVKGFIKPKQDAFTFLMNLKGKIFRQQKNRTTMQIALGQRTFFIKQHRGIGWFEIFKNLCQLRLPVLSAKNEWLAIQKMQTLQLSVPQLFAYGERGVNPAAKHSFVLLEDVAPAVSLEDLTRDWLHTPPAVAFKRQLIQEVASIARKMHENGINHRDFYLCHFLLRETNSEKPRLTVIDLHRAQIRPLTPSRWIIKDLAGLYFSSKTIGLTKRDLLRFARAYRGGTLNQSQQEQLFWQRILNRGEQLFRDHAST